MANLLVSSAQWWNDGPLTAGPLAALAFARAEKHGARPDDGASWYRDVGDGPWGPPP